MDRWQREGVPIVGAGSEAWQWELDRLAGMREFKRAGIPVPPFHQCGTLDEAMAYVAKRGEGMAVKPCGDVTDKSLSFVAKTPEEMLWRLGRWKKEGKRFPSGIIMQDLVKGIEFAVGAWLGPGGFAPGWEENFEEKRLFAGGIGPNCGEAGTVLRLANRSKIANKVLKPLEDRLVSLGYVGNVDVNTIVDDEGNPWPLEFTVRFGYPAINIELALHSADPIEFLAAVAQGAKAPQRVLDKVAVGVVLALPPYPFSAGKTDEVVGVPITGVTPGLEDAVHYACVALGEGPALSGGQVVKEAHLVTAGSYVLVSTAVDDTVTKAKARANRVLERINLYGSPFYRNDVGERLRAQLPKLQEHGFALGLQYA
jgi:phosphoribosylamine--glycine ligase